MRGGPVRRLPVVVSVEQRRLRGTCRACAAVRPAAVRVVRRLVEPAELPGCGYVTVSMELDPAEQVLLELFVTAHAGPYSHLGAPS